jgi:uncharacterized membrane protein YvbJ
LPKVLDFCRFGVMQQKLMKLRICRICGENGIKFASDGCQICGAIFVSDIEWNIAKHRGEVEGQILKKTSSYYKDKKSLNINWSAIIFTLIFILIIFSMIFGGSDCGVDHGPRFFGEC